MSHDKISAAARQRMARTGEPYAAARRAVIAEHQAALGSQWFEISWRQGWYARLTRPRVSGVAVDADHLQVRMGFFRLDIPRTSVRSVTRSEAQVRGTLGVHETGRGRLLVNGSAEGLIEITLDPPVHLKRTPDTLFRKPAIRSLTVSLATPDAFIAALEAGG
jgi:hypothetical protein